jgi:hypothetical protein
MPASGVRGRFLVVVAFLIEREPGSGRMRQGEAPLAAVLREAKGRRDPPWN